MPKNSYKWNFRRDRGNNNSSSTPKSPSLTYTIGIGSDKGKRRTYNEDSVFCVHSTWNTHTSPSSSALFALSDGMGGYADGQVASNGAIQTIVNFLWPKIVRSNTLQPKFCSALLTKAIQLANATVRQRNIDLYTKWKDHDFFVGATITAAMIVGSTAYIANVGNCRTYLYRASAGLKQITTDHTWIAQQVAAGTLEPDAIYTHLHRNQITRGLGTTPPIEADIDADIFTILLQPGDTLLLCSPGLWQSAELNPDPTIEHIITHSPFDPSKIAADFIQYALDAGGKDNVSVLVAYIQNAKNRPLTPGIQFSAIPNTLYIPPS